MEQAEVSRWSHGEIERLVRLAANGDADALEGLLGRYRPYLRIVAQQAIRRQFDRRFDASDAVQQTFLEAFHGIASFRGNCEPEFNAWITRILERNITNLARDHTAGKRDVRCELAAAGDDSEVSLVWIDRANPRSGPESRTIKGEAALMLAEALTKLTERQGTAVEMRFLEGCKLAEIAEQMGITPASVAGLIERGVEALRGHLPGELGEIG